MATRKSNSSGINKAKWNKFGGMLSFWAIIVSGTVAIINFFISKVGSNVELGDTLSKIISLMLFIGLVVPSYMFLIGAKLPGKKFVWKIIYWVIIILLIIGVIGL